MIKAKQKNLRVFDIEIENENDFFTYMEKNYVLLKEYPLVLSGNTSEQIRSYLDEKQLLYLGKETLSRIGFRSKNSFSEQQNDEKSGKNPDSTPSIGQTLVYNRPIRSGEIIESDGDIVILNRVNSGAKIRAQGNVQIFGELDGIAECEGEFMILQKIRSGHAVFDGEILNSETFDGALKKIMKKEDRILIEEI